MDLNEAMFVLERAGLLVEAYPGEGYKKPVLQMLQEIEENNGDIGKLVDFIIKDKSSDILKAFKDATSDFREIKSDTGYHGEIYYAAWFKEEFAKNSREAISNGRYIFSKVSKMAGIPIKFSQKGGAKKRGTWSDYWCIDFNILTKDDGSYDFKAIAEVIGNDDKYWEILDELYAHRKDRTVKYVPSDEEKETQRQKDLNDYIRCYVDPILDAKLTAKDLERYETSTVTRQLGGLGRLSPEKSTSRRKAILAMALRNFGGFSSTGLYFYTGFFHRDDNRIIVGNFAREIFGMHIPSSWRKTNDDYKDFYGRVFEYCKKYLDQELKNIYGNNKEIGE